MAERFCGNCGSKLEANSEFCGNCGSKCEKEQPVQQSVNIGTSQPDMYTQPQANTTPNYNAWQVAQPPKNKKTVSTIGIVIALVLLLTVCGMFAENYAQDTSTNTVEEIEIPDIDIDIDMVDGKVVIKDDNKTYSKGTLSTSEYSSEFIGVRYTPPSGWVLATENELAQLAADEKTTWEMQAINNSSRSNVLLAVEKLISKNIDEASYLEALKGVLKSTSELSTNNITILSMEETGVKSIAGKNYQTLSLTSSQSGIEFKQVYYVRKINTHMVVFLVTSLTDDDSALQAFTAY